MKKLIKVLGIFIFTMFAYVAFSDAAISASSSTVNSGGEATISITSDVAVVSYSVTATDLGGTTFVTSSGGTGAGTTTITDAKDTGMTSLATFKVKVPEVTVDTVYTVTFTATAMDDTNLNAVADSTATAKITVKAPVVEVPTTPTEPEQQPSTPVKLSSNANLRNLGINPNDFSGFKPGITSYNVEVKYDVSNVSIYAYAEDDNATVAGIGKKSLSVGKNTFEIVVTAQDGKTTKTYTLEIKRLTEEETEALNKPANKDVDLTLSSLKIEGITLVPEFSKDIYIYSAELTKDIEELEISATQSDSNVKIEIEGNEKIKEGENVIKIKLTAENGETAEYKITVKKDLSENKKGLSELKIKGITLSPSFDSDVYNYVATLTEDVTKLEVTALKYDGTTEGIEITGNEKIEYGDNTITILVYDEENDETLTYQILITKELKKEEEKTKNGTNIGKIILIVAAIIIVIALVILLKPSKKKKINSFGDEEENYDDFNDDNFNPFDEDVRSENEENNEINNYNIDRSNEYNVFEDEHFNNNNFENNEYNVDEDVIENDEDIEERRNRLKGKRKGKHF